MRYALAFAGLATMAAAAPMKMAEDSDYTMYSGYTPYSSYEPYKAAVEKMAEKMQMGGGVSVAHRI